MEEVILEDRMLVSAVSPWNLPVLSHIYSVQLVTWTFRAALSSWRVRVGAVEWRAGSSLTIYSTILRRVFRGVSDTNKTSFFSADSVCVFPRIKGPSYSHQTGADVARLIGGCEPLSVAVDAMVVGAAVTLSTTGSCG